LQAATVQAATVQAATVQAATVQAATVQAATVQAVTVQGTVQVTGQDMDMVQVTGQDMLRGTVLTRRTVGAGSALGARIGIDNVLILY
jgi:hypothetical protein